MPNEPISSISYDNLKILLETLENEIDKIKKAALDFVQNDNPHQITLIQPSGVIQSIKAVVKLMGSLETVEITEAIQTLKETCNKFLPNQAEFNFNSWESKSICDIMNKNCEKIRSAVQGLLEMYSQAFRVDFALKSTSEERNCK